MDKPTKLTGLASLLMATLIAAGCGQDVPTSSTSPVFATQAGPPALDQRNGTLGFNGGNVILKGFNPTNPHVGDAIVATFMWFGSNTITSVTDHLTNGTPVGNTYTLLENVTLGNVSMATYVATNARNFPDPNPTQDEILVVQANFASPVSEGGIMLSAYTGVEPVPAQAIGAHHSASGTGSTTTTGAPGPINVGGGALVYTVMMSNNTQSHSAPAGYAEITNMSNNAEKTVGAWTVQGGAGTADPQWTWYYSSPGTWLATVLALNAAGGSPPPTGNLTVTTSTTGSSLDPDGFTVSVDGGAGQPVGTNGSLTFNGLSAGSHSVALSGVASNCSVTSGNPQTANVPAGGTGSAGFSVSCNSPPTVNAGADETVVLGALYTLSASFTDPDGDGPWSYRIDWGDGTAATTGTTTVQGTITAGHTYLSPLGNHTIIVTVTDSHGASGSDTKVVTEVL